MGPSFLAAIFAISAATAWGSGGFTGGLASRRVGPFHAVLISHAAGLLALVTVAIIRLEMLPPLADFMWGGLAGLSAMAGLVFFFQGIATGRMGIVAPVSAVLATAIPVIFVALTGGIAGELQLLGFGLAVLSIWLLSRPERFSGRPAGLSMALLSGLGFGGFFIAIGQVGESAVFWPLAAGRLASFILMLSFAFSTRRPVIPLFSQLWLLVIAGVLDVSGNLFFLLSIQSGRLDISAVLGSLYPAVTVFLAWLITKERMARLQVIGIVIAIMATVLIAF